MRDNKTNNMQKYFELKTNLYGLKTIYYIISILSSIFFIFFFRAKIKWQILFYDNDEMS